MIVFDKNSWHYRLIVYIFSNEFFLQTDGFDLKAMDSMGIGGEHFDIIYKKKPKTVNLCPYCRALVVGVISLPFVWLFRKLPHKKKKPLTHQQVMKRMRRRSMYVRYIIGTFNIVLGITYILTDRDYTTASMLIGMGVGIILMTVWFDAFFKYLSLVIMPMIKFVRSLLPKRKQREEKPIKPKNPSLLWVKLNAEHEKICPAIYFIDKLDQKVYK